MRKFSQICESLDKWEDVQDYLLELTDKGVLKLHNEPKLVNDYGESGNDFNPTIYVGYHLEGFSKITDISKLESYISTLSTLSTGLKRSSAKFKLRDDVLIIYFDLPSKLVKLVDDIRDYHNSPDARDGYPFLIPLREDLLLKISFEIDKDFNIKLDVQGLSWGCIGKLNKSESLQSDLINLFVKKYQFKFDGDFTEDRHLDPHGRVKHWYFTV